MQGTPTPITLKQTMETALKENISFVTFKRFQGLADQRPKPEERKKKRKPFVNYKQKDGKKKFRTIRVAVNNSTDSEEEDTSSEDEDSRVDLNVVDVKNIECYNCHKKGHFTKDCKEKKREQPFKTKNIATKIRAMDF